jgi:DNA repair protein RecO (recombination protein O)
MATRDRERLYRTEAIVLRRVDFGEADRIFTVYTPHRGKLQVVAKGVRRPASKMGPHLEYFTRVQLMLAKGRELDVITGAETVDAFLPIRASVDAVAHASHMAELLNRLTQDRQENVRIFELLARSLKLLADGVDPYAVTRHFEIVLLSLTGFRPELYECVQCRRALDAVPNQLSYRQGGMLCPECRHGDLSGPLVSVNAQKYLRLLDRSGLSSAIGISLDASLSEEIERVMSGYLRQTLERDLNSLRIWHKMKEPAGVQPPG